MAQAENLSCKAPCLNKLAIYLGAARPPLDREPIHRCGPVLGAYETPGDLAAVAFDLGLPA